MRKLSLKLESLAVESFETTAQSSGQGTVQGAQSTRTEWNDCWTQVNYNTCGGQASCDATCATMCQTCPNAYVNTCNYASCDFTKCCVTGGGDISKAESCQTGCGCTDTGGETGYTDYGCGENTV